jgi:hypothetical protein
MCISFGSFVGCIGSSCGVFFVAPIIGIIAVVCGIIGIIFQWSIFMLITVICAIITVIFNIIGIVFFIVDFSGDSRFIIWPLIMFIIATIAWAIIAHLANICRHLFA